MIPNKHHAQKARKYHNRWCITYVQFDGTRVWRFMNDCSKHPFKYFQVIKC